MVLGFVKHSLFRDLVDSKIPNQQNHQGLIIEKIVDMQGNC